MPPADADVGVWLADWQLDQRAAHYDEVGWTPPDLVELADLAFGAAAPAPMGPALRQAMERARSAAGTRPPRQHPLPDPDLQRMAAEGMAEMRSEAWRRAIPSRFQWARPGDFSDQVAGELVAWGARAPLPNLLLLGATGVGKTHAAVAAAYGVFQQGLHVRFTNVVTLLQALRPDGPPGLYRDLVEVDVLALDDLGAEKPSDWTQEQLYALVNDRWMEERCVVATSNLEPDALRAHLGERTYSRLAHGAVAVQLGGNDRRRAEHG